MLGIEVGNEAFQPIEIELICKVRSGLTLQRGIVYTAQRGASVRVAHKLRHSRKEAYLRTRANQRGVFAAGPTKKNTGR